MRVHSRSGTQGGKQSQIYGNEGRRAVDDERAILCTRKHRSCSAGIDIDLVMINAARLSVR